MDERHHRWWVVLGDAVDCGIVSSELHLEGVEMSRIILPMSMTLGRRFEMCRTIVLPSWRGVYDREQIAEWVHQDLLTRYGPNDAALAAYDIAGMGPTPPWRR